MEQRHKFNPIDFREKIFKRLPELEKSGETRIPNQKFWDFYHVNKKLFYRACISVVKREDEWRIVAHKFVDREAEYAAKIQNMLEKHLRLCPECKVENKICVSIMRDGRKQFQFYCLHCYQRWSSALPYALVAYLKENGYEVIERSLVFQERRNRRKQETEV